MQLAEEENLLIVAMKGRIALGPLNKVAARWVFAERVQSRVSNRWVSRASLLTTTYAKVRPPWRRLPCSKRPSVRLRSWRFTRPPTTTREN